MPATFPTQPALILVSLRRGEEIANRLGVCNEKHAVLITRCAALRFNDMREARYGELHALNAEDAALIPHRLEVEAGHDEREIDVQAGVVRRADESPVGDDTLGKETIPRLVERLCAAPQFEPELLAHSPRGEGVIPAPVVPLRLGAPGGHESAALDETDARSTQRARQTRNGSTETGQRRRTAFRQTSRQLRIVRSTQLLSAPDWFCGNASSFAMARR